MNGTGLAITTRGIIGSFFEQLEAAQGDDYVTALAMHTLSDQEQETYAWLGMVPTPREWIGGRAVKTLREGGLIVRNKKFEATLEFDADDRKRDKTGQTSKRVNELIERVGMFWRSRLSTLIANGHGSTSGLGYDGQYFFDTDHSEGDSGTQKNLLTDSDVPALNVGTATAPTEAEFARAVMGVISYMKGIKDDQGEPIHENAKRFLVMVPLGLEGVALSAATERILSNGATTASNPLLKATTIDVIGNPRLSWTTDFAVFRVDGTRRPFILQTEGGVEFKAVAEGSELEFNEDKHRFGIKFKGNVAFGDWKYAAKATLA
jgi:phage major head subunit gpT-like protein